MVLAENGETSFGFQMQGANLSFSLFFVVPDYASGGDVEYSYICLLYTSDAADEL